MKNAKRSSNMKILGLQDTFTFGKHKGEMVEDVIHDDGSYITWCLENEVCEFDEEAMKLAEKRKLV